MSNSRTTACFHANSHTRAGNITGGNAFPCLWKFLFNHTCSPVKKVLISGVSVFLIVVAGALIFTSTSSDSEAGTSVSADAATMVVYKDPNCGCCASWIEHVEGAGFEVEVRDTSDMNTIKTQNGIDRNLSSCHTALIDGYVVEGHVPAEDIIRMLEEKPAIKGLAVPGMPIGSPGMEQGAPANYQAYDVVAFDGAGNMSRFRHVEGGANSKP